MVIKKDTLLSSNLQNGNVFPLTSTGKCIEMKTSKQLKSPDIMKLVLFLPDLCESLFRPNHFTLPFKEYQSFFLKKKKVFIRPKLFALLFLPFTLPLPTAMSLQCKEKNEGVGQCLGNGLGGQAVLRAVPARCWGQSTPPAYEDLRFSVQTP